MGEIEILSHSDPIVVSEGEGDAIVLSLMHDDKSDCLLAPTLEGGKPEVELTPETQHFDLSVNPDKIARETLEISVPASAKLAALTIRTQDSDAVTIQDVAAATIDIVTDGGDVRLTGAEGEAEARMANGELTATAELSAEIDGDSDRGYSYTPRTSSARASSTPSRTGRSSPSCRRILPETVALSTGKSSPTPIIWSGFATSADKPEGYIPR